MTIQEVFAKNISHILGRNKIDKIAVAVSGGADSVALLHLMHEWAAKSGAQIVVLSIDHNLRPEAKLEIGYVRQLSTTLGLQFVPLFWDGSTCRFAVQEKARIARYTLMRKVCAELGVHLLLTAHHLNDMLETYLIKRAKKASAMSLAPNITTFWDDLWIARPLFNIEKQELITYLQAIGIRWFEDASNELDKYERNRVRKQLQRMTDIQRKAVFGEYTQATREAQEQAQNLIKAIAEIVSISECGFAVVDLQQFKEGLPDTRINLMNYVLTIIGGKTSLPRYRNLEPLLAQVMAETFKVCTLHHCKVIKRGENLVIHKEKQFVTKEMIDLRVALEQGVRWDERFVFERGEKWDNANNYTITTLSMKDYVQLRQNLLLEKLAHLSCDNHKAILFTLPVIKKLEKVVAIPHISYYDDEEFASGLKVIFKPGFVSRFTHFF